MIEALAASVVSFITPALIEIGKGAADKLGETGAGKVLSWLRAKTTGRAREALDDLEKQPSSEDNQADLRKQLVKLLQADSTLVADLRTLLPAQEAADRMEQNVIGDHAKGSQIKGSGNIVNM